MISNNTKKYTYSWLDKSPVFIMVVMFSTLALVSIKALIDQLIAWNSGESIDKGGIIVLALTITAFGLCLIFISNMNPNIQVSDVGLRIQVFLVWWIFVPWADVQDIRPIFGDKFSRSPMLVLVRKLTPIHSLIFGIYTNFQPAFMLGPKLKGYAELVGIIEKNIHKV